MYLHQEILDVTLLQDLGGTLVDEVSGSSARYDHHLGSTEQARERKNEQEKQSLE